MKYLNVSLSDKTPIKFKIRRLIPYGIDIAWKYTDRLNFCKYINLDVSECMMYRQLEVLEQLNDNELVDTFKQLIEEDHEKIKSKKRSI